VSNGTYQQNVSGDYALQAADIVGIQTDGSLERDYVRLNVGLFPNMASINNNAVDNKVLATYQGINLVECTVGTQTLGDFFTYNATGLIFFIVPTGTTLSEAQTLLAGTVIRYQLATPIDTLNTPPLTQWVDYTDVGNNATLQGFANTKDSGMDYEPFVNENGTPVNYDNLATTKTEVTLTDASASFATDSTPFGNGKRIYVTGLFNAISGTPSLNLRFQDISPAISATIDTVNERVSYIGTTNSSATNKNIGFFTTGSTLTCKMKDQQLINLTDNPQVQALETQLGRQLTKEDCDRLFPFVATTGVSKISNRPVLQSDGLDDRGTLSWNVPNIGSGEDFALCWGGIIPSVVDSGFVFSNNLLDTTTEVLASLINANGSLGTYVANSLVNTSATNLVLANSMCDFRLSRKSGTLKLEVWDSNGVKTTVFSVANSSALTWQTNTRIFCRSNNSDGTAYADVLKIGLAWCILAKGDIAKLDATIDKLALNYRLKGV
jgi:hypothetical protein